ncbi:MAG TPA: GNAT family N-acetyltransferase [Jatrophihabitans sp.]|jgi:RimJ/RimL family protein N-acetyltransferase|uniref:GNAT family N-acetyltransferase n=1 Tax=Jatrophihabitans sp. TaxID=1932789 RepID=UPI002EE0E935
MAGWSGVELDGLVLHSGRLTLRPWQPEDAAAVRAVMADERMHQHLALPWPYTDSDAHAFVTGHARAGRAAGSRLDCAIAENASGRLVGSATLQLPVGADSSAEIGYWIAAADWGRGYATEATRTLTRFGLANGLARIQIRCEVPNAASAVVALRAGFAFEGVSRASLRSGGLGGDGLRDGAVFARTAGDPDKPVEPSWPKLEPLSDGVITLRPGGPDDWPVLLAEANNEAARQWALYDKPMPEAGARAMAARAPLDRLVSSQNLLLICEAASGAGAGVLGLRRPGPPNVVALGYGVLPEFRGRGFTARALRLLADWAFSTTPTVRLELGCKAANVASARAALSAGFTEEGRMGCRLPNPDGSHSDEIGFGLVRPAG